MYVCICMYVYMYIHGHKGFDLYIRLIPEGMQHPRETTGISVKPRARLCYNIYVTISKSLSLCSARNAQDIVSKILCNKTEAEEKSWR